MRTTPAIHEKREQEGNQSSMSTQGKRTVSRAGQLHRLQLTSYTDTDTDPLTLPVPGPRGSLPSVSQPGPVLGPRLRLPSTPQPQPKPTQFKYNWATLDTLKHHISSNAALSIYDPVDGQDTVPLRAVDVQQTALQPQPRLDAVMQPPLVAAVPQDTRPVEAVQSEIAGTAGNAASTGLANISTYFFRYGSNFIIQRGLGAGMFGLYSLTMSLMYLIATLFNLGLDDAMVRYVVIYRGRKQMHLLRGLAIFSSFVVGLSGILGAFLVLYFSPQLASLEHKPLLTPLLLIMAPLIPLLCMQVIWMGGLQGFKDFKKSILRQRILSPLVLFTLCLVAYFLFRNIEGFLFMTLIGTVFATLTSLYFFYKKLSRVHLASVRYEERNTREKYDIKEWFSFAIPNFLTSTIGIVLDSIDTLLLGVFAVSNVAIGQYSAAIKLGLLISLPLLTFNTIFSPTIAELHSKGEHTKLNAMFKIVTKWIMSFSLPIFGIVTLFSPALLGLSGDTFTAAWPMLVIFACGSMISAATGSVGYILMMTGHQKLSLVNSLTAVSSNIVLGIILTPRYGAIGTAISTSATIALINIVRLLEVRFLEKLSPYRWDMLKPLGAALLSGSMTAVGIYAINRIHLSFQVLKWHVSVELALVPLFCVLYALFLILFKFGAEDKIVLDKLTKKFRQGKSKSSSKRSMSTNKG